MAALGELLFYVSTQDDQVKTTYPPENKTSSGWQVPNTLISLVTSLLRKGEDIINNLCYIFRALAKPETMKFWRVYRLFAKAGSKDGDARLLCLKIWFEVVVNMLWSTKG
ncbi:hypothetical protein QVD17_17797 [Tagetes erecta]|uniref:Uncharacterized protein n=1 Tax=Tagetes erecta TaxID=13708 RepID=A0AAD8P1V7_TARER|nr:hypothetical protein QVD17_17797 [Tagetes erecta]